MIEQLKHFISDEGLSMLPVITDYFISLFVFVYNAWFMILFKTAQLFLTDAYWVKVLAAFLSFFATIYTLLYGTKITLRLTLWIILEVTKQTFCYLFSKFSHLLKTPLERFQKPKNLLTFFRSKHTIAKSARAVVKHSKVASTDEIEAFEQQLKKRGYSPDCFELREEASSAALQDPASLNRQIIAIFKETGKWRTYPCGGQNSWVEGILQDLDDKVFADDNLYRTE